MNFNTGDTVEIHTTGSYVDGLHGTIVDSGSFGIPSNSKAVDIGGLIYSITTNNLKIVNKLSNGQPLVYVGFDPAFTNAYADLTLPEGFTKNWQAYTPTYTGTLKICAHKWRKYFGLNEKYQFCEQPECKEKRDYDA